MTRFLQARFLLSKVNPSQTHNTMYSYGTVSVPSFFLGMVVFVLN
jgi:hypothetical protein